MSARARNRAIKTRSPKAAFFSAGLGDSPKMHLEGRSFAPPEERLRSGRRRQDDQVQFSREDTGVHRGKTLATAWLVIIARSFRKTTSLA